MNPISNSFPVFGNIIEAMNFITELEKQATYLPIIMPSYFSEMNPFVMGGRNLDKDDFLVTRLICNDDDVEYYKMLEISNEIPYLSDFKRYSLKPNLFHSRFLFRGQRKDYNSIRANLFRNKEKHYFLDDTIKVNELTAFLAMHPLVQLLGIKGFKLCGKPMKLQANLYGLAQHYYNKTVEVDFSSSLDVAAFFAVTEYDKDADKYFPIEDDEKSKGVLYVLPISTSLTENAIYGHVISSIGKQFCFERPSCQLGFLVNCEGAKDLINHPLLLRIEFHHNKAIAKRIHEAWNRGETIAPPDPLTRYWRKYRDNKETPFSISDKAIELNLYANSHETRDSIVEKILAYRNKQGNAVFQLSGHSWPKFPREILEEYWLDIKNGWWEDEFCNDIYFPTLGKKYKEALKKLPSDPCYRSAFYEA